MSATPAAKGKQQPGRYPGTPSSAKEGTSPATGQRRVRLEISAEHLSRLLASRQLCAADFRCLDGQSRCCVRALCQRNCSRYLAGLMPMAGVEGQDVSRRKTPNGGARRKGEMLDGQHGDGCRKVSDGVYLTPFFLRKQALAEDG